MTRLLTMKTASTFTIAMAVTAACNVAAAANPVTGALGEIKPIVDMRLRYETVDQVPLADDAEALVIRTRLGVETGRAWNTSLLVEGEFVGALIDDYREDPAVPVNTTFPVVPDPEAAELNRFQFTNISIPNTTITLGRQRINIDDQRFIGNVGWRMNEQTFDALRVVTRPAAGNFFIDVTYSNRVNRIFGPDSPQGVYKGDVVMGNLAYQFRIGKLTVFNYLLDFDPLLPADFPGLTVAQATPLNPERVSTNTLGVRFAGETPLSKIKLGYALSYAQQQDYGDNPVQFDNDYFLAELSATYKQYSFLLGNEILGSYLAPGSSTPVGFATPLATLHKFQGWVDKFLTTPGNGIDDRYGQFTANFKGVGPLETVTAIVAYHTYESDRLSVDYGSEINASLAAKKGRFTGTLKYGDYSADAATPTTIARDTRKFWAQLDYIW